MEVMTPGGMFSRGHRPERILAKDTLPISGKPIPEFDDRRSIRDMFRRKASLVQPQSAKNELGASQLDSEEPFSAEHALQISPTITSKKPSIYEAIPDFLSLMDKKKPLGETLTTKPLKRVNSSPTATTPATSSKGQQSLKVFSKRKALSKSSIDIARPDVEKKLSRLKRHKIFRSTLSKNRRDHRSGP